MSFLCFLQSLFQSTGELTATGCNSTSFFKKAHPRNTLNCIGGTARGWIINLFLCFILFYVVFFFVHPFKEKFVHLQYFLLIYQIKFTYHKYRFSMTKHFLIIRSVLLLICTQDRQQILLYFNLIRTHTRKKT